MEAKQVTWMSQVDGDRDCGEEEFQLILDWQK
jgi:hypothetical protein